MRCMHWYYNYDLIGLVGANGAGESTLLKVFIYPTVG